MPELPDIEDYIRALRERTLHAKLERVRLKSFSLLRTYDPPVEEVHGREVTDISRLGKRIVFTFSGKEPALHLVLHLMIAGRLAWHDDTAHKIPGKVGLCAFDFESGTLILREAGTKKRAALHVVDDTGLAEHDRGGIDPLTMSLEEFEARVAGRRRTLKRFLTDQHELSGIGNAFSDEILVRACLSPIAHTTTLDAQEISRLYDSTRETLTDWTTRLAAETGRDFPTNVTAFRDDFIAHGKYGDECRQCEDATIARIRYAKNETNYCPRCQTDGTVLKDRGLSKLLGDDWPSDLDA